MRPVQLLSDHPLAGISQRLPPANLAAEQALLGAIMANNKAYDRVSEFLAPAHFADPVHALVYERLAARIERGAVADAVTLKTELEHDPLLAEAGGTAYLAQLLTAMVGIINAGEYGRAVRDAWLRRELIDVGELVVNRAFGGGGEPLAAAEQLEAAEVALFSLSAGQGVAGGGVGFDQALQAAIARAEFAYRSPGSVTGLTTGLADLDRKSGGLHPDDLTILAGRPGMGKTALATKIAYAAARSLMPAGELDSGRPAGVVAIFSLEMSAEQLAARLLAEESRVSGERIRRGEISQREFDRFVDVQRRLVRLPLHIDDTPALSITAMRTRCRRLARTQGLKLVVVDYLQLMRPPIGAKPEGRVLEISMITQGLKALAKEFGIPVLALSQLSRAVESREDKRPQLSDLRESGSIEQDADAVMFVYRDEYYLQQRMPQEASFASATKFQEAMEAWQHRMELAHNKAELLLEKQRHGPTGRIELFFEGEFTRFADLDQVHQGQHA